MKFSEFLKRITVIRILFHINRIVEIKDKLEELRKIRFSAHQEGSAN